MPSRANLNALCKYNSWLEAMQKCAKDSTSAGLDANRRLLVNSMQLDLYKKKVGSSIYIPFVMGRYSIKLN